MYMLFVSSITTKTLPEVLSVAHFKAKGNVFLNTDWLKPPNNFFLFLSVKLLNLIVKEF